MTSAPATGPGADPLGTIPMFDVNIPLTPARAAAIRRALADPGTVSTRRRELGQHEHHLISAARKAGAAWQQIADCLGYQDRQAAQQRHQALGRALAAAQPSSRTHT